MTSIRVLIIDDSAFMRKMITEIITSDQRIDVVGTARNGQDGLRKIQQLNPDVITLDIEMPMMDGIETLENIMELHPKPVVMLSSLTSKGATKTLQALSLGAIDFIEKPSGPISLDIEDIKQEIIDKVITASQVKELNKSVRKEHQVLKTVQHKQSYENAIVAIGTSTGGPRALQQILTSLPSDFPAPILIVQHMPAKFTKSLADRLNSLSSIHVKEAAHGDIVRKGTAYIAPGNYHMHVRRIGRSLAISLSQDPLVRGHRPAADTLFQSIAQLKNINKIAVVLTGMGKDGSDGIKYLKEKDQETIILAEAESSAIVYGMPAAAIATGHVNKVLHLADVSETVINLTKPGGN